MANTSRRRRAIPPAPFPPTAHATVFDLLLERPFDPAGRPALSASGRLRMRAGDAGADLPPQV